MKWWDSSLINLNSDPFCQCLWLIPSSIFTKASRLPLHRPPPCNDPCTVLQLLSHVSQIPSRPAGQSALLPWDWHFWSRPTLPAPGRSQTSDFPYWTFWQQGQLTFFLMDLLVPPHMFLHHAARRGHTPPHIFSGKACVFFLLQYKLCGAEVSSERCSSSWLWRALRRYLHPWTGLCPPTSKQQM